MERETRRSFLTRCAGGATGAGALVSGWPFFRCLVPNVLYEAPKRFKIGLPERFQEGVTFLDERRIFLFKEGRSFHAISGICTHLGCTVNFAPFGRERSQTVRDLTFTTRGEFHCPCHGSKFHGEGTNFAGPAPRPLPWHPLEISPAEGELMVDVSREVDRDYRLVI
ncbi:MAG: ubiquinol-cytochrome c reductase iron-sulfur subunit [Planctomycetota bacterium]